MDARDRKRASEILWMHGVEWPARPSTPAAGPKPSGLPPERRRPREIDPEASLVLYQMGIE